MTKSTPIEGKENKIGIVIWGGILVLLCGESSKGKTSPKYFINEKAKKAQSKKKIKSSNFSSGLNFGSSSERKVGIREAKGIKIPPLIAQNNILSLLFIKLFYQDLHIGQSGS